MALKDKVGREFRVFLLGSGIQKSLSPRIQNLAFRLKNFKARYSLIETEESRFDETMKKIIGSNDVLGFNLTAPFKGKIISYLSTMDSRAKAVGAVNTVKVTDGSFHGFNTDVDGIIASFRKLGLLRMKRKRRGSVLGAGGAARSCVYALALNGFDVSILNRTVTKAKSIAKHFEMQFPKVKLEARALNETNFRGEISNCDVLINAISLSTKEYPIKLDFKTARRKMKVLDLGYGRPASPFIRRAMSSRLKTMDGLLMLVEQAASSFEIWTNLKAPRRQMLLSARKHMI